MTEPVRIIHATDFSSEADAAEAEAIKLARALGAELVLVHVSVENTLYGETAFGMRDVAVIYEEQARWAEARLSERVERVMAQGVPARWSRRTGVAHAEIVKAATEERADYIVVGTHGRGGMERAMLGSVADRVIRSATCPVVIVRAR